MEWMGILAGFVGGVGVGLILALYAPRGATIERGGATSVSPPLDGSGRSEFVTRADLDAHELALEDMYDKLHHLYDRTRKRIPPGPGPTGEQPLPVIRADAVPMTVKERKAAIRERLRQRRTGA